MVYVGLETAMYFGLILDLWKCFRNLRVSPHKGGSIENQSAFVDLCRLLDYSTVCCSLHGRSPCSAMNSLSWLRATQKTLLRPENVRRIKELHLL